MPCNKHSNRQLSRVFASEYNLIVFYNYVLSATQQNCSCRPNTLLPINRPYYLYILIALITLVPHTP